ncbi:hypothetical protein GEMRC1_003994 [Eukaryota sp. GEM-RC1]
MDDPVSSESNIPSVNEESCCSHVQAITSFPSKHFKVLSKSKFKNVIDYYAALDMGVPITEPSILTCNNKRCCATSSVLSLCLNCVIENTIAFYCYSYSVRSPHHRSQIQDHIEDHYSMSNHSCFFHIHTSTIICYSCQSFTPLDPSHSLYPILSNYFKRTSLPQSPVKTATTLSPPLLNLGNSCYFNSALECLLTLPLFNQYFLLSPQFLPNLTGTPKKVDLLKSYISFVTTLYNSSFDSLSDFHSTCNTLCRSLWSKTKRCLPVFNDFCQHDAAELLTGFLTSLGESMGDECNQTSTGHVSNCFKGELISKIKCFGCEKEFCRREVFLDLSLPIPTPVSRRGFLGMFGRDSGQNITLTDCLLEFFKPEPLENDDLFECEVCKSKQRAEKRLYLSKVPEILILHLKRFKQNGRGLGKNRSCVDFPKSSLCLSEFLNNQKSRSSNDVYDLYAIVNHHGNVNSGHYTSVVKVDPSTRAMMGKNAKNLKYSWEHCDDCSITPAKLETITKNDLVSMREAYILFYARRKPEIEPQSNLIDDVIMSSRLLSLANDHITRDSQLEVTDLSINISTSILKNSSPGKNTNSGNQSNLIVVPGSWLYFFCYASFPPLLITSCFSCPHDSLASGRVVASFHPFVIPNELFERITARVDVVGPIIRLSDLNQSTDDDELSICSKCDISHRQIQEKNFIYGLDSSSSGKNHLWFIISNDWLNKWKTFTRGDSLQIPGPIDNSNLLMTSGCPKPMLVQGKNYRALTGTVLKALIDIYGGGPIISRIESDIYSQVPSDQDLVYKEYGGVVKYV